MNRGAGSKPLSMACSGAFLLAGILTFSILGADTLTYREVEGRDLATHVLRFLPQGEGLRIELSSSRGAYGVRQTFLIASDWSTREWTFSDPTRTMELAAVVRDDKIILSGSFKGQRVDKRFDARGAPWNQLFQMGLGPFVLAGGKNMTFRSIGTQGPGELKIGKMSVTRKQDEEIELEGRKVTAVHVRISLSGLLSIFWHGDYWYRKSDGRFLRYRGKNRSGGPIAVSELVKEETNGRR